MPIFISTSSATTRHGSFAIEKTPPAQLTPTGTGVACLVEQFPWGPSQTLYTPTGIKDLINTFSPPGFSWLGSGHQAIIKKGWPTLKVIRALNAAAVAASVLIQTAGSVTVVTVNAKYPGAAGNSLTATVSASTDGVSGHFMLTVSITGPSGTTTDVIDNLNFTGVGANSVPDLSKMLLIGSIVFGAAGSPALATTSFSSGSDGTIAATDYIGTQGNNDKGIAKAEGDMTIRHVFCGDPGNTFRPTVNAGLEAHAAFMGDRVAYLNGPTGQTPTTVATDVANYRSTRVVYCDPWVYILDDVTGAKTLVPPASFAASVACQVAPSTPISWKNPEIMAMLSGINDLEADRGNAAGANSLQGICTVIREANGGFTFEAAVVTIAASDNTRSRLTRTRMGDYIAVSFVNSTRPMIDAPNVPFNQQGIVQAVDTFMAQLKQNASIDPNHRAHVLDYQIANLQSVNSPTDLANGLFYVPLDVQTSAGIEKLLLSIRFGENVTVQHQS